MVGYKPWIDRAVAFEERIRQLPGKMTITTNVAPPLTDETVTVLSSELRIPIPLSVRHFLVAGSGGCHLSYAWFPGSLERQRIYSELKEYSLHGGGWLCDSPSFGDFQRASHDLAKFGAAVRGYELDRVLCMRSFPFLMASTGDLLALDVDAEASDPPVVYLSHDGDWPCGPIAPSFDDFLEAWEQLCYIDPSWLYRFLNAQSGYIDGELPQSHQLRRLLGVVGPR